MKAITVKRQGNTIVMGDSPQLIVELDTQQNYILAYGKKIPYNREVTFSRDLLSGKRKNVYETAVRYYYQQACTVAEGMKAAEAYRPAMNTTTREVSR